MADAEHHHILVGENGAVISKMDCPNIPSEPILLGNIRIDLMKMDIVTFS